MSDYTITNRAPTTDYWISRDEHGEIVEEEIHRNLYVIPPAGQYRLRFKRFAKPFDMKKAERFGGGTQTKTRLEVQIIGGKGDGKKVSLLVGWAFGSLSTFGKVIRACLGRDLGEGEEVDLFGLTNTEFVAYLQPSEDIDEQTKKPKYVNLVSDTIKPIPSADDDGETWDDEASAA